MQQFAGVVLAGVLARAIEAAPCKFLRQVFLLGEVALIVVCVLVSLAVAHLFHELGRGVAYVQRDGQVAEATDSRLRFVQGHIGGVALHRAGEIDRTLRERYATFWIADLAYRLKAGVGQQQRVGVGVRDVLRGEDEHTAGDEQRIFATLYHPG